MKKFLYPLLLLPLLQLLPLINRQTCLATDWSIEAKAWPEADTLFRRDSRWRGADAANSVDLGNNRVLWTFGDSFVDPNSDPSQRHRRHAAFIRNSIAIQVGYDTTSAEFHPYWQEKEEGKPSAFFRSEGEEFFWPAAGLMLDEKLLVFLMRIRNRADTKLGFGVEGWGAVLIDNPQNEPNRWQMEFLKTPQNSLGVMVGSGSSLRIGDWIYSHGSDNTRRHQLYLTRVPLAEVKAGDFSNLQWWDPAEKKWTMQDMIESHPPQPIAVDGQAEFTVHYEDTVKSFLLMQFKSFPRGPIVIRDSKELTGEWSPRRFAFLPEEAEPSRKDTMVYAAKAHPEQIADGLAVTYCTNTFRLDTVREDESLYFPRFVRFNFKTQTDAK